MNIDEMIQEWRSNVLKEYNPQEDNKFDIQYIEYTPRFKHICPGLSKYNLINKIFFKVTKEYVVRDAYPKSISTCSVDFSKTE